MNDGGAPPLVECRDVTRMHAGDVWALRGVTLCISPGELVAVVGPSGSGKSTLLQLMGTLDRPTSGSVVIDGHHASEMSDRALSRMRASAIGFVFQQFHLSPLMSARDNVAEGLLYTGAPRAERQARATEVLETLGLGCRLRHRPNALSGGERQRVAIARALVSDPQVILADEPTGNLDTASGAAVLDALRAPTRTGAAVVVVTHDLDVAERMDRQIVLRDGLVVGERRRGDPPTSL